MSNILKLFAKMLLVVIVLITVFLYLLAIVLGPALFYFTEEGVRTSTNHFSSLKLWLLNIPISIPIALEIGLLFFCLWSIFLLCFIAAWKLRDNFHKTIKESVFRHPRKLFHSCLFTMPILNSMTLIVLVAINMLQEAEGIPIGTPPLPGEPFLDFFQLSYSAVIEEVGFRLIPIGSFLIIYLFITKKKTANFSLRQKIKLSFTAIMIPDRSKRIVGAKTVNEYGVKGGISLGEWSIVIYTSIVFGLAHFDPGTSWEIGKITPAAVTGLVLGLSYLMYGIQAPIIMHWFFNVYPDTYLLLSELQPALGTFANGTIIFSLILGILGWSATAIIGLLRLHRGIGKRGAHQKNQATLNPQISPW